MADGLFVQRPIWDHSHPSHPAFGIWAIFPPTLYAPDRSILAPKRRSERYLTFFAIGVEVICPTRPSSQGCNQQHFQKSYKLIRRFI